MVRRSNGTPEADDEDDEGSGNQELSRKPFPIAQYRDFGQKDFERVRPRLKGIPRCEHLRAVDGVADGLSNSGFDDHIGKIVNALFTTTDPVRTPSAYSWGPDLPLGVSPKDLGHCKNVCHMPGGERQPIRSVRSFKAGLMLDRPITIWTYGSDQSDPVERRFSNDPL